MKKTNRHHAENQCTISVTQISMLGTIPHHPAISNPSVRSPSPTPSMTSRKCQHKPNGSGLTPTCHCPQSSKLGTLLRRPAMVWLRLRCEQAVDLHWIVMERNSDLGRASNSILRVPPFNMMTSIILYAQSFTFLKKVHGRFPRILGMGDYASRLATLPTKSLPDQPSPSPDTSARLTRSSLWIAPLI